MIFPVKAPYISGFLKRFIWPFQKVTFDVPFFNLPIETGAGPVAISKAKQNDPKQPWVANAMADCVCISDVSDSFTGHRKGSWG